MIEKTLIHPGYFSNWPGLMKAYDSWQNQATTHVIHSTTSRGLADVSYLKQVEESLTIGGQTVVCVAHHLGYLASDPRISDQEIALLISASATMTIDMNELNQLCKNFISTYHIPLSIVDERSADWLRSG